MYNALKRKTLLAIVLLCASINFLSAENLENKDVNNEDICNSVPFLECPPFVWLKPIESDDPSRTGYPVTEPGGPGCSDPIVTYYDDVFIINSCHLVITRIWRAEDPNNPALFDTCHQTIKVVDEEAPVISNPPEDIMIYTNRPGCKEMVTWEYPEIYDNSALDYVEYIAEYNGQTFEVKNGDKFSEGITEVTLTAYDFCGNISSHSFIVNIMCAQCHVECPEDACLPVGSDISPDVLGYASSYSGNVNCGLAEIDFIDIIMETGCNGKMKYMRIWEAEFETMPGFIYNCAQMIELKNETEISLHNCPTDIVIQNNFTPVHWETPVASNGNNLVMLTSNYQPGTTFPVGITTVIYTASDLCGNEATCSFKISVLEDVSYPDCPDDIILNCDETGAVLVNWIPPTYSGTCSSCGPSNQIPGFVAIGGLNGSRYYCSSHFYTFEQAQEKATKLGGHIVSIGSQQENDFISSHIGTYSALIGLSDYRNEGEMIWESGEDLDYSNWFTNQPNDRDGIQDYVEILRSSGEWNDIDNGLSKEFVLEIPCTYVTQIEGPEPGTLLDPGTYTVVYKISDGCGLEEYCEFTITVVGGISVTSCPADIIVDGSTTSTGVSVNWDLPEFLTCCDLCNSNCITLTQAGPDSGTVFLNDTKSLVSYTAIDNCGNKVSCSFFITVLPPTSNGIGNNSGSPDLIEEDITLTESEESDAIINKSDVFEEVQNNKKSETNNLKIFPNPAWNIVNINLEKPDTVSSIAILSFDGKLIQFMSTNIRIQNTMDIKRLAKGMYFLKINLNNGEYYVERLVKL